MKKVIGLWNDFMAIAGSAAPEISEEKIEEAREIIVKFDKQWKYSKQILGIKKTLGAKHHYPYHCIQYMSIWAIPLGYISEQSVESFQKVCQSVFNRYQGQRGTLKLKYAIHHIMTLTSPTYQD